jgi:VCBS repeat-containing protein
MTKLRTIFFCLTTLAFAIQVASPALADDAGPDAVIPVVGSTLGAAGANFRTEAQLHNPTASTMRGRLAFVWQGIPIQPNPVAELEYLLAPRQTIVYEDLVAAMGGNGLGSIDVFALEGGVPTMIVRAFDDKGDAGTTGLMVPVLDADEALTSGRKALLVVPGNLTRYRFNIGVRTLPSAYPGALLRLTIYGADGAPAGDPVLKDVPVNFFAQAPAQDFIGRALPAGSSILAEVLEGRIILYSTTTDNLTNDGSIQIDRVLNLPPVPDETELRLTTPAATPVTVPLTVVDPDDDPISVLVDAEPAHGAVTIAVAESAVTFNVTYSSDAGFEGEDTFVLLFDDGNGGTTTVTFMVTVGGGNAAPFALGNSYTLVAGETLVVPAPGVLGNDGDPDGDPLTAVLETTPANAVSFNLAADGSLTYTPFPSFIGADLFTYRASDGTATSNLATVVITVRSDNTPPAAVADAASTDEDTPVMIDVLANDTDAETPGQLTLVGLTTTGTLGTVALSGTQVSYDPTQSPALQALAAGSTAIDTFQYTIRDPEGLTASATVTVTVNGVDDPATAVNDAVTVLEDSPATPIDVLANDTDIDGGTIVIDTVTQGASGTVVVTGGGTGLTYQPAADFCGSDSFTYTLAGGSVGTVSVTVTCVNDAPSFTAGSDQASLEDAGPRTVAGWATALSAGPANESGQVLAFSVLNDNNGLFSAQPAIDATGTLTYTSAPDANGVANVTVTLSDDGGTDNGGADTSAGQSFVITVTPVNDAPTFVKGSDQSVAEDSGAHTVVGWATAISAGPADEATQVLGFTVTNDDNALFAVQPGVDVATGTLTFTPANDAFGVATVNVVLSDDGGTANGGVDSSTQTFTITVSGVNDAPTDVTLSNDTIAENQPAGTAVGTLTTTDVDTGDTHAYTLVAGAGDTDNASFQIVGDALQSAAMFDFETKSSYSVRVRSTDAGGLFIEKTFAITVSDANEPPTDVALSNATIAENQATGTPVGTLTTTDSDPGDTFTYTLVAGTGDTDNASFQIVGDALQSAAMFDFETKSSYSVRVRTTDAGGLFFEKAFTITVTDANEAPTDIALSNDSVDEGEPAGTTVGTLSTTDQDAGDSHAYTLVSGTGDADNASFQISGAALQTAVVLDYNVQQTYSVRVRTTDAGGLFFEESFTINLNDVNVAPTDIALSNASVAENQPSGTAVGTLSTTDADAGDTFAYTLVSGTGDSDNASFQLSGSQLQTAAIFDFETKSSYSVRVRTTDGGGLFFEKAFTITVTNANEAPTDIALSNASIDENQPSGTAIGNLSTTDPDVGDTFTYTLVAGTGDTDNASFQIVGAQLQSAAMFDFETKSSYSIRVRTTDAGGLFFEEEFTISIVNLPEAPLVTGESFDAIGNTLLEVDDTSSATGPKVYFSGNLLANDIDPDTGSNAGLTASLNTATVGASVTVNSDGTFTYLPPAGHAAATDTFTYDVSDGTGTGTGTVTINLSERVWYVDPTAAGGGDGRSSSPFNSFASLNGAGGAGDVDVAGDYIFVHDGSLALASVIELEASQHFVGEGAGLSIPVNLNGAGSPWVGVAAGTRPQITNTTGDVVRVTTAVPLEIVGLSLASTTGNAIDMTTAAALTGSGTLTIGGNELRGAGAEGIDVNMNAGTTGTLALVIAGNTWSVAGTHTGNAIDVNRVAGTLRLNLSNNTNVVSSATAINVVGGAAASTTITGFSGNTVHQNTGGSGILVSNATFDAVPGGTLDVVSGGNTRVGVSGDGVGASGISMTGVVGHVEFTDLDVYASSGSGLLVTGTGAFTGATGTQVTVQNGSSSDINATNGPAVSVTDATLNATFNSVTSTNSASTGVLLTNVGGTFVAGSGSAITNAAGTDFAISGGNATVTYSGTITDASGTVVSVASTTGGTKTFGGAISSGAISLTNNTGATINFTGGLTLSTGASPAFTATGAGPAATSGGTINVTGTTNTLTTTTGTALNVLNTTIGANNLVFRSISSNGSANGISLQNTGSTGGLKVQATGTTGTGGTIQNTTGAGIVLADTAGVDLQFMNVTNPGTDGIRVTNINGLTINGFNISDSAGAPGDRGIDVGDFSTGTAVNGTISITNSVIGPAAGSSPHDSLGVGISSGTSTWNVTGTTFQRTGNAAINLELRGTATVSSFTVSSSTFAGAGSPTSARAIFANTLNNSSMGQLTIQTSSFTNNNIHIDLNQQGGSHRFSILNNNTMTGAASHAINVFSATDSVGTFTGTVQNNAIGTAGSAGSGSSIGNGIRVNINGGSDATMLLNNNTIRQTPNGRGIEAIARNGTGGLDITITSNNVNNDATVNPLSDIVVQSNCLTVCNTLRSDVRGNTVKNGNTASDLSSSYLTLFESSTSVLELVNPGGGGAATCAGKLGANNTGSTSASAGCALIAGPISVP